MRQPVEAGWRGRAAIDDDHAAAGLKAVEAAIRQRVWAAGAPTSLGQRDIDQGTAFLLGAIDQSEAAVAMPHHPERLRYALDGTGERERGWGLGDLKQGADLGQV